jgi:hypothetical protein
MICKVFIAARLLFDKICEKNKLWHYVFTCVQIFETWDFLFVMRVCCTDEENKRACSTDPEV